MHFLDIWLTSIISVTSSCGMSECYSYYYYYFTHLRVFHTSINRWFSSGFGVTTSLLNSPGLYSVLKPISKVLQFGWSPLIYHYYYFTHLRVFHTSINRWFSSGVRVTSLLKSPGLYLVLKPISTVLQIAWSPLIYYYYYYYYYDYYFTVLRVFFTPALTDGFPVESEW